MQTTQRYAAEIEALRYRMPHTHDRSRLAHGGTRYIDDEDNYAMARHLSGDHTFMDAQDFEEG